MTKQMTTKPGTEAAYKRFLNEVNLYALGLDSVRADIQREAYVSAHSEASSHIFRVIESSFELTEFTRDHFDVQARFTLRVKLQDQQELPLSPPPPTSLAASALEDDLLYIKASFTAHFHSRKDTTAKGHAERFADSEARLIFWPYFRQMVSDLTSRMAIRPITVPLTLKP